MPCKCAGWCPAYEHCSTQCPACSIPAKSVLYTPDGTKVAALTADGVDVYTVASGEKVIQAWPRPQQSNLTTSAYMEQSHLLDVVALRPCQPLV